MADNLVYKDVVIPCLGNTRGTVMAHVNLGGPAKYRVMTSIGEFVLPLSELSVVSASTNVNRGAW